MASNLKSYEKKIAALEEIVQNLDENTLSINDLLVQYKKGLTLVKECSEILNSVDADVKQIIEEIRVSQ